MRISSAVMGLLKGPLNVQQYGGIAIDDRRTSGDMSIDLDCFAIGEGV